MQRAEAMETLEYPLRVWYNEASTKWSLNFVAGILKLISSKFLHILFKILLNFAVHGPVSMFIFVLVMTNRLQAIIWANDDSVWTHINALSGLDDTNSLLYCVGNPVWVTFNAIMGHCFTSGMYGLLLPIMDQKEETEHPQS